MMKLRVMNLLICAFMLVSFAGCSLFTSDNDNTDGSSSSLSSSESIAADAPDYSEAMISTLNYYRNTVAADASFAGGNYWHASFLAATDTLEDDTLSFVKPQIAADGFSDASQAADYAGAIISLIMMGEDPETVYTNLNLVTTLTAMQGDTGAFPYSNDSGEMDSADATIWSVIALNMAGGTYDADAAAAFLKGQLKEDGGLNDYGDTGSVDTTAAAIIAMAKLTSDDAKEVLNAGMKYLKSVYNENGYFVGTGTYDSENTCSQALAISALIAANEDIYSDSWLAGDKNMVQVLLSNQDENGGFWYNKENPGTYFTAPDDISTSQALFAVACAQADRMLWYSYSIS